MWKSLSIDTGLVAKVAVHCFERFSPMQLAPGQSRLRRINSEEMRPVSGVLDS